MIFSQKPENFNPRFEVVSCFWEHDGKILLLHRQDHKSEGNTWGVPAGKKEPHEDIFTAMLREIKEETGLKTLPQPLKFHATLFVRYEDYDFLYHTFSTKFTTKPEVIIDQKEHKDFCWVTPQDALKLPLVKDMDACLKLFFKN